MLRTSIIKFCDTAATPAHALKPLCKCKSFQRRQIDINKSSIIFEERFSRF